MKKNILNIKSNYNFLHSLAFWALSQYPDPLQFSNVTILLPSRRACREIKNIFLQASGKEALILPNIRAIGDVDYDELNLSNSYQSATSPLKYHLLLIEEIKKWNQRTNLFGKNISADQISAIAANLESFLQEVEKEKLNLEDLENVEVEELASHKQQILSFLRHFGSNWQSILRDKNIISIANYRNLMIEANAHHLRHNGSEHPIIIAGSTGSVKATAALIKVIANLENGFVLLCGLDKDLSADIWQELPDNHPQFMLKKLLNSLKIAPNQVNDLCFEQFKQCDDSLNKLTSYAMLPDYKTNIWQNINDLTPAAISHLSAIELDNSFEEARLISLIMRSQLENPDIDIALVSNCQNLTFMVREELKKWDIAIDDSKNNQLSNSPIVNYLLSIAQLWEEDFKSVNLLAILKHPLTKGAMDEQLFTNNLQKFELQFLRATNVKKNFTALREAVKQTGDEALITWFEQICTILEPFAELFTQKQYALKDALLANINCAETLTGLDLYSLEGAEEFRKFAQDINQESDDFTIEPQSYSKLLIQLMNGYSFSKKGNFHPRLHILSTMEARLVNKDVMIISGLNDGEFPSRSFAQNWLGAKMREDFGLPSFNQSIGVAAYDLGNYLGNRQVFLTRAHSNNNSPTLKSPFLLKLETVLKIVGIENDLDDGSNSYKAWLTQLNKIAERQLIKAPCPKPKLADRPKSFSVTDIGKWLKDPYYIYAKRVLKLKKLDKIDQEPSFAQFGNFVHQALENFIGDYQQIPANQRLDKLLNQYGKEAFAQYFIDEESALLWWSKFADIAAWFVAVEEKGAGQIKHSLVESQGELMIGDVKLTTKIDRININHDGSIEVIDYKTGAVPIDKDIKNGLEPQLALEALVIKEGKLKGEGGDSQALQALKDSVESTQITVSDLQYFALKGKDKSKIESFVGKKIEAEALIEAAKEGLIKLISIFNDEDVAYICLPKLENNKNDYHHLSRIDEWQ